MCSPVAIPATSSTTAAVTSVSPQSIVALWVSPASGSGEVADYRDLGAEERRSGGTGCGGQIRRTVRRRILQDTVLPTVEHVHVPSRRVDRDVIAPTDLTTAELCDEDPIGVELLHAASSESVDDVDVAVGVCRHPAWPIELTGPRSRTTDPHAVQPIGIVPPELTAIWAGDVDVRVGGLDPAGPLQIVVPPGQQVFRHRGTS